MTAADDALMQALSEAGAICGDCGDEPGDRTCPDCERCRRWYVDATRKAGWAPRAEVLREAAAVAAGFPDRWSDMDAMKAAGVIGPHTMSAAIRDALCAMADAAEAGERP